VLNESELTLPEFLEDFFIRKPRRIYASGSFADLKKVPPPRWELLDLKRYAGMSIQFSRGCPFQCDLCNVTALLGHRVRTKTSRQILTELDGLYRLGWRDEIFFVDDNFIGNSAFLKADLLPALIEWRQVPVMNIDTLPEGYGRILRHIYAPEHFYQRVRTFLREYKPPENRKQFRLSHILTLVRSLYQLGILSRARAHYWRLLFWTQWERPQLIPEAITLAICGYHYRKVCRQHVA